MPCMLGGVSAVRSANVCAPDSGQLNGFHDFDSLAVRVNRTSPA